MIWFNYGEERLYGVQLLGKTYINEAVMELKAE